MTLSSISDIDNVILWRCPKCGSTEQNSGQSGRYCGRTKGCVISRKDGIYKLTLMERWEYAPVGKWEHPNA